MGIFSNLFKKKSVSLVSEQRIMPSASPQGVSQGSIFYPLGMFYDFRANRPRTDYDFHNPADRVAASMVCTPLHAVLSKIGDMAARGVVYVTDKDNNEPKRLQSVRDLIAHPNPLQSYVGFIKQIECELRLHGYVAVKFVRALPSETPRAMWVVPSELLHVRGTGRVWEQFDREGLLSRIFIQWGGYELDLSAADCVIITDGSMRLPYNKDEDIRFYGTADALSLPVNNWVAQMSAAHTLLVNGGPKGIISGEGTDSFGATAVTKPDEEEIKEAFKAKYGLVNKQFPLLVTRHPLRWQPMDFNAQQLRIDEEDNRCTAKICNALGLNPNLFTDAKYDNQESAKKAAYQDVVIPDSQRIAEALTASLCRNGDKITLDYTGVECLQKSRQAEAQTLSQAAEAISKLTANGLVSIDEAREVLAGYIDIDPSKRVKQESNNE